MHTHTHDYISLNLTMISEQLSTLTHLISLKTNSPKTLAASYIILIELYVCANIRWEEKEEE